MLDKAAGHWWGWGSAAGVGSSRGEQLPTLMGCSSSTATTPKPLPAKISAHLAAGAVLVIGKTCDIVILPLKPFFCKAAAFLCFSPLAEPCAFNAFSAALCLQTKQCCCPGIYIWILPVSQGAHSQSQHQQLWTPQRPPVRHSQWWVGALHAVLLFLLKKSMRDSYRHLADWWRAVWSIPKFSAFCRYALA